MHGPRRQESRMTSNSKKNDEPLARWEGEGGAPAEPKAPPSWLARMKAWLAGLWSVPR